MMELIFGSAFLISYVLLFYNYHITGRKALVYYALAWFSLSIHFFLPRESIYIASLAFFASLVWVGNIMASEELLCALEYSRELRYFAVVPLASLIFLFPRSSSLSLAIISISIFLSGLYLVMTKNESLRLMGLIEVVFSLIAFLRGYYFESVYALLLESILAFVLAYVSIKTFLDSSFIGDFEVRDIQTELKPGLMMTESLSEDVLNHALVFSRMRKDLPNWFWITKIPGDKGVAPTNLAKILDIAVKFMKTAKEEGKRAVIVLDGLEYLVIENGFPSILKFLATLRDYALLNDATVVILGDDSFLDERERKMLRRLLD